MITYIFIALFLGIMGYMIYFQVLRSEDFINSLYNRRQDSFAEHVTRGEILSADGKVLARTVTDSEGNDTREYPYGNMYAHVVGFSTHGKSGIESSMNFNLLRSHAFIGSRVINELKDEKNPGDSVVTTLDSTLQETAYRALGSYDGAVIVMEPATGKILAMVSKPDFDPNTIARDWDSITGADSESTVLLNRATQGLYPPGSTFKILTTLAYIRENPDYEQYQFTCDGSFTQDNTTIHCYNNAVHGQETLADSFANSCNASYASLGLDLDVEALQKVCSDMMFDSVIPIGLESSQSRFVLDETDSDGMKMQTAIGQGETMVTPLHMLLIASAVANDGMVMKPYVVDHTENDAGILVKQYKPSEYSQIMTVEESQILKELMGQVVSEGTASQLSGRSYSAYGKTGSAEFSNDKSESHSWFVGFAHRDDKEDIAVVVIAERGGAGSSVAVPAAKQIFNAYYGE